MQGKIEIIQSYKKQPIDLKNLFLTRPLVELPYPLPLPRVTLLEGTPGGGKSTLALHVCRKWAKDTFPFGIFDLVILVYLRDQAIQNATTLADILPNTLKDSKLTVATHLQATYGFNVLFIFDGWDEFPSHLQTNSLVSTIIREPHHLSLHLSTVLITSRPVASGNLLHIADRRVEILGFAQHQIREYIEKSLDGNSTHIQKLVQHLQEHPVLESYCYVPLHVAILVHIFLTMKGALPTTLHELFCALVLCCVVRELETHDSKGDLSTVSSLNNLPNELKFKLSDLCILAYEGVMQNKVVFYSNDLIDLYLPANLPSLGLLQAVEGLTLLSKSLSYNFLHLSVQELLAAYHISHMDASKQLEQFKRMFGSSRFQPVLYYYSGFTKLTNPLIQSFISAYSQQNSNLSDLLHLLHCFYEAKDLSLCSSVMSKFTKNNVVDIGFQFNPSDYLAVGYYITSLLSSCDVTSVYLKIKDTDFDCQKFKLLLFELTKKSASRLGLTRRLEIELNSMSITKEAGILIASHFKQLSMWSNLILRNCEISNDGLLPMSEALQRNDFTHFTELQIIECYSCSRRFHIGLNFKKLLQTNKSLTHLSQSGSSIMVPQCIFQGLQHNTGTLVHLDLSYTGLKATVETAHALTIMLQVNKTLTHLDLSENETFLDSERGVNCICQGLQHNTTLRYLNLKNTGLDGNGKTQILQAMDLNLTLDTSNLTAWSCNIV